VGNRYRGYPMASFQGIGRGILMGSPHTTDICDNCREPIIQWNNTGAWEHLGSARMDQTESRAYIANAKTEGHLICANPRKKVEQDNTNGRTNANYRTAKKPTR
jgi:hypothetical protein